jgi:hypothetical protein
MNGARGFFNWSDEPVPMGSRDVINGPIKKLKNLERDKEQVVQVKLCHNNFSSIVNFFNICII